MKPLSPSGYRWCPRPIPNFSALCLDEPSDRFINFASFDTGVFAFECAFSSLMPDAVYVLRIARHQRKSSVRRIVSLLLVTGTIRMIWRPGQQSRRPAA
jgi:hypothetical protein